MTDVRTGRGGSRDRARPASVAEPDAPRGAEPKLPVDPASAGPLPAGRGAPVKRASFTIFAGFFALLGSLVVLGAIAEGLRTSETFTLDTVATPFLHGFASPGLDAIMNAATFAGSNLAIPPLFVLAIIALVRIGRPGGALFLAVASGGSLLLNTAMKLVFERPRPSVPWAVEPSDYSFPSGHTMNSVAFYVALAIIVWSINGPRAGRMALAAAALLALLVGVSRIYLGYHYFTDVLGGILAGVSWLLIVLFAFRSRPLERFWFGTRRQASSGPRGGSAPPPARRS